MHLDPPPPPFPARRQDDDAARTEAVPARPLDGRLLRAITTDVLGRSATRAERDAWIGKGLTAWSQAFVPSAEFWSEWLEEQLYYFLLVDTFRPPDDWIDDQREQLSQGRLTVRQALHRIALSASFDLRNPGADTFVTVVMEQLCGLRVEERQRDLELGKRAYDGAQARFLEEDVASQSDVVRAAIEHEDATRHLVLREVLRFVGEEPDRRDLRAWSRSLHRDSACFCDFVRIWLQSDAWARRFRAGRPKSNRVFVRALYVDLLDRLPEPQEIEPLRYALDGLADPRPLRSVLVRSLVDSDAARSWAGPPEGDGREWIAARFERFLGRPPSAEESDVFVATLASPGCRPETVDFALLTGPEYHRT